MVMGSCLCGGRNEAKKDENVCKSAECAEEVEQKLSVASECMGDVELG